MFRTSGTPTDPELREKIKEEVKNEEKGMAYLCPNIARESHS
jgi:hypothetical protein